MKMIDQFKLPCRLTFGEALIFRGESIDYALHAINNHDALVEVLSMVCNYIENENNTWISDHDTEILFKTLKEVSHDSITN